MRVAPDQITLSENASRTDGRDSMRAEDDAISSSETVIGSGKVSFGKNSATPLPIGEHER
jgi:hypothetical protein